MHVHNVASSSHWNSFLGNYNTYEGAINFGFKIQCLFGICHVDLSNLFSINFQTVIHLGAILMSLGIYFAFTIVYNSIRIPYIGYSTSYGAVLKAFASPVHWSVVALSIVTALLPRYHLHSPPSCSLLSYIKSGFWCLFYCLQVCDEEFGNSPVSQWCHSCSDWLATGSSSRWG